MRLLIDNLLPNGKDVAKGETSEDRPIHDRDLVQENWIETSENDKPSAPGSG
jgi:hypothetical protein